MRTGGAGSTSASQVDQWLDDTAATIETSVVPDLTTISFSTLKESATEVLGIYRDVLAAPRFEDEKIEQARARMRDAIAHPTDDAARIAHRELSKILNGARPDYASLGNLLRSDLQAFHSRYFTPADTQIAIRGDFHSAEMKAQIEKLFAEWKTEQPQPEFPKLEAAAKDAPGIHLAAKKDIRQAFFAAGQIGGTLNDKDNAALAVMANVLGGPPPSRLSTRLAERSSSATVTAKWEPGYGLPGLFEISGSTASLAVVDTVKAIQDEMARIRSSEVSDEELKAAKEAAIASLLFAFDTREKILDRLLMGVVYGYPADFFEQYQKALEAVTRADVLRVAKEHLHPEAFATVLVGDPADFVSPIESLNQPVHTIDLTVPAPKITAVPSDAASLVKGKSILVRLQQAVGGLDKLAAIKDSILVADYKIERNGRVTAVKHTERWITPLHYREENEIGGGTITAYLDGQFGWITVPGGSVALTGSTLREIQGNASRQLQLLFQAGTLPGTTANAVDDRTVEITGPGGQWTRVTADPDSGLPVKLRYEGTTPNGPPEVMEETWSDFREVAGIKVPFSITMFQGGRKYADVTLLDFRVNTGLKLADLEKRR